MHSEAGGKVFLDNQDDYILCHQYHYNLQLVGFVELTIQAVT